MKHNEFFFFLHNDETMTIFFKKSSTLCKSKQVSVLYTPWSDVDNTLSVDKYRIQPHFKESEPPSGSFST